MSLWVFSFGCMEKIIREVTHFTRVKKWYICACRHTKLQVHNNLEKLMYQVSDR